jgi:cathepsin L
MNMKLAIALLALCLAVFLAADARPIATSRWHQLSPAYSFDQYITEFAKSYPSASEYASRKAIFEQRLVEILTHNADEFQTYKKGVNHMTDYTDAEFRALLGYRKEITYAREEQRKAKITHEFDHADINTYPTSVDWRTEGVISGVKDQGHCGSCWTFATAENIESFFAIKHGYIQTLSEQQILDCTPNPEECGGTGGCQGGTSELAMDRLANTTGGLATEWTYPYQSYQGNDFPSCNYKLFKTPVVAKLHDYRILPPNQYTPVIAALQNGPLSISVDASAWSSYEEGVFTGCAVTNPDINHAVQAVGYGTDPNLGDFWIVRNSWFNH